MELLDALQMEACNRFSKLDYPVAPTIFFEFHGSPRGVEEQAETVKAIAGDFGGDDFRWSTSPEERNRLWQARHDAFYAALAMRPGAQGWPTDVCVPISRLAECIAETQEDLKSAPFPVPIVGHAGDGNLHLVYVIDLDSQSEVEAANAI